MSQPYLFYSERCPNSKQIIETLKALNKAGLYKFILVESLPRDKIPSFLTKVPTLYLPETKDVIVGKDIFGYIAKPTAARKEIPTNQPAVAQGGSSFAAPGEYSPWGFEKAGLGEKYSLWDAPQKVASEGASASTALVAVSLRRLHVDVDTRLVGRRPLPSRYQWERRSTREQCFEQFSHLPQQCLTQ